MHKLEKIKEQIRSLSRTKLVELRKWYAEFDAHAWDRQFEADVKAGKLDALAEAATKAHKEGKSTEF